MVAWTCDIGRDIWIADQTPRPRLVVVVAHGVPGQKPRDEVGGVLALSYFVGHGATRTYPATFAMTMPRLSVWASSPSPAEDHPHNFEPEEERRAGIVIVPCCP